MAALPLRSCTDKIDLNSFHISVNRIPIWKLIGTNSTVPYKTRWFGDQGKPANSDIQAQTPTLSYQEQHET